MASRRAALAAALAAGCGRSPVDENPLAERYVRLILGIGLHDANYVDAYYGPASWKPSKQPLVELLSAANRLLAEMEAISAPADSLRHTYLVTQTRSAIGRIRMLSGERFPFDEESRLLYAVAPPAIPQASLEAARAALEPAIPGAGSLEDRYTGFQRRLEIPPAKLDATFRAAIEEARKRAQRWFPALPKDESFEVEYVRGKSWSAYNWYKGHAHSLIQVNAELPVTLDRVIHLACHEGYPGHHVYNALLESQLVRRRGWAEYSVYPLYSPQSLIAEGTADFGARMLFNAEERAEFAGGTLAQAAGLDRSLVEESLALSLLLRPLRHASIEAARGYLDGGRTAQETITYLRRYALQPQGLAERRIRFFDEHRAYIINYSFGEDLVAQAIDRAAPAGLEARWRAFSAILSSPRVPATL